MSKASVTILTYLKSLAEGIEKNAKELKEKFPPDINKLESKEIFQLKRIIEDYNSLRSQLFSHSSECLEIAKLPLPYISDDFLYNTTSTGKTLKITLYSSDVGEAISTLNRIENICHALISVLESIISPLTLEEKAKLEPLKEELSKISMNIKEVNFEKNLRIAINEYEKGDYLCAWLIAGRIITYMLQCIPGKTIDEKIAFLKEKGIITKDKEDVVNFIIKTDKETRNIASHNILAFPTSADAISLIADCIKLLEEIWIKYEPIL